jgi:ATP-dependent Lhr-like helicase
MAALRPYVKAQFSVLKKGASSEEEKKELKRIYKNANLVMANGKKAVMALVGRGVGPDTAARILAKNSMDEEELLRDILAAEVNYARTKRFWD